MAAMVSADAPGAPPVEDDPRWRRFLERDPAADGLFVVCVRTTGIYCRPTCPARRPKPANVAFASNTAEARALGFRPCLRCDPDGAGAAGRRAAIVESACRTLDSAEEQPSLADLARAAGVSPFHLHRLFKAETGLTPKAWGAERRAERAREELARPEGDVTRAIYEAGFGSSGRFYESADRMLGMTPSRYKAGGAEALISYAVAPCWLGHVLVAASERGICAILLGDDPAPLVENLRARFARAAFAPGDAAFEDLVRTVVAFVEEPRRGLALPLDIQGTAFQRRVWRALADIPPGETASYSAIADRIGASDAVRAVAGACAANWIAVAVPCHRVVRSDGGLSGYRWGVARKRALLDRERG